MADAVPGMPRAWPNDRQGGGAFGGHNLNGAARILGLTPANVVRQLEEVLSLVAVPTTRSGSPSGI